jgi:hypothetical protein
MDGQGETRTLTALYEEVAAAERAIERLTTAGIPPDSIETERAGEAKIDSAKHGRSRLMSALWTFEMPEPDRQSVERGLDRGGVFVVVHDVPEGQRDKALDILDEGALEFDVAAEDEGPDHAGAIGTMGGSGIATGDVDRLTGRRLGPADPPDDDARKHHVGDLEPRRRRARSYAASGR